MTSITTLNLTSNSFSSLSEDEKGANSSMPQWLIENKKALAKEFGAVVTVDGKLIDKLEISQN